MSSTGPDGLSALTLRLFDAADGLEQRLKLSRQFTDSTNDAVTQFRQASGWPGLVDVIGRIVNDKRPVLVYGDYDTDGAVSTFLLFRALRTLGVSGNCFLPNRFRHGYGLDSTVIEQAIQQGYQTLLALDCGTANHDEIGLARQGGMEVAVIDHHQASQELPDAALLNPHCEKGFPPYCTAGLIYYVILGLRAEGFDIELAGDELDLAGLATIADVVPLVPENWVLAHHALLRMPETVNAGLSELIKISKLHGLSRLTGRDAAFSLVPRLNAAGRMRSMKQVLDLFGSDAATARTAAMDLDRLNNERRDLVKRIERQAVLQALAYEDHSGLVLYQADWHIGVIGIVAAKVLETTGKPTVILTDAPNGNGKDKLLTGSVRSDELVDIVAALGECEDSLVSYGGHAAAAGVKLDPSMLAEFRVKWHTAVANHTREGILASHAYPEIKLTDLTESFERDIWQLAPFGPGHTVPRCIITGCHASRVNYMGRDKTHLNITISDGACETRLAGFNLSHLCDELNNGCEKRFLVEIEPDNWNNRLGVMLRLIGIYD